MAGCPHDDVQFCPLYVAAHDPRLAHLGCDDGHLDQGSCGASRKISYAERLARLRAMDPRIVAICEFGESTEQARRQRERNMRLAGIH